MFCQSCGARLPDNAKFCDQCGASRQHHSTANDPALVPYDARSEGAQSAASPVAVTTCRQCGSIMMAGQGYCYGCGNQFAGGVYAEPGSSGAGRLWLAPQRGYGYEAPRPTAEGFDAAKFFTFHGRIGRGPYWSISIVGMLIVFASLMLIGSPVSGAVQAIAGIVALASYWMMLAASVKR